MSIKDSINKSIQISENRQREREAYIQSQQQHVWNLTKEVIPEEYRGCLTLSIIYPHHGVYEVPDKWRFYLSLWEDGKFMFPSLVISVFVELGYEQRWGEKEPDKYINRLEYQVGGNKSPRFGTASFDDVHDAIAYAAKWQDDLERQE